MNRISKVLCPIDFSAFSQGAMPIACSLARDYGATLMLMHVRPETPAVMGEFGAVPPEPRETEVVLKARLKQCVPSTFAGRMEFEIRDGNAAEAILETAKQKGCDFIVMGTHGRTGLSRILVGSVAEAILRQATCPVLTIKPPTPRPTAAPSMDEEPERNVNDLVTVCSVANPMEAEIIQNALKAERIPCFIEGAQQAGIVGTLGIPIRVQVRLTDYNRANKFIKASEAHRH